MSELVMVFKISDMEGGEIYLQHDENVMSLLQGFVDYAEPGQTLTLETVMVTREELEKLPRGFR